jgi:hemerythrin superfamily protein
MNAIELLKDDHRRIAGLLASLAVEPGPGQGERNQLLERLGHELQNHTSIEEEIFYPAFRDAGETAGDERLYLDALEAHRAAADLLLPDLLKTPLSSEHFNGRVKVLRKLTELHIAEEEQAIFPRAASLVDPAQLQALGDRMAARKRELERLGRFGRIGRLAREGSVLMDSLAAIVTPETKMPVDDGKQPSMPPAAVRAGKMDPPERRDPRQR